MPQTIVNVPLQVIGAPKGEDLPESKPAEPETEFGRFEALTRKLVQTPKPEKD